MNQKIEKAFIQKLQTSGTVPVNCLSWYLRWFRMLVEWFPFNEKVVNGESIIPEFKRRLAGKRLMDFQVRQAVHCAELFFLFVKADNGAGNTSHGSDRRRADREVLLGKLERDMGFKHMAPKSIKSYRSWARRFMLWAGPEWVDDFTGELLKEFLTHLAVDREVGPSTQNQAFNALLYFYRHILHKQVTDLQGTVRSTRSRAIPAVLSGREVKMVLDKLEDPYKLMAKIMYGCGLRLHEVVSLRLKDVHLEEGRLSIQLSKGQKSRALPVPRSITTEIENRIKEAMAIYRKDLQSGTQGVFLPPALERAHKGLGRTVQWQWLFPAFKTTKVPSTGERRRCHVHDSQMQKRVRHAAQSSGLNQNVTPHTLRHSYATQMLKMGYDIRTVQERLGHSDIRTTMIYTHIDGSGAPESRSPLDEIL